MSNKNKITYSKCKNRNKLLLRKTKMREQDRIAKDLHDGILNRFFTTRIILEELGTYDLMRKRQLIEELQKIESLNIKEKTNIYLIVQELLYNANKHSI